MKEELINVWKNIYTGEQIEMPWVETPNCGCWQLVNTIIKKMED